MIELHKVPDVVMALQTIEMLEKGKLRIDDIKKLRKEMIRRGFNAPYKFILKSIRKNIDKEEAKDIAKHMEFFRKVAVLKKYALSRITMSLASHIIKKNAEKHGYTDIIQYLPVNGDYITPFLKMDGFAYYIYRTLYEEMASFGEVEPYYAFEIEEMGMKYYIYSKNKDISKEIPDQAQVKGRLKKVKIKPLIKNRSVRKVICSTITQYAWDVVKPMLYPKDLEDYNNILKQHGIMPLSRLDFVNGFKEVKEELAKQGFMEEVDEGVYITKKEVAKKIEKHRLAYRKEFERTAKLMLYVPIIKHYLKNSRNKRKENPLYPSMSVVPTTNELQLFRNANNVVKFDVVKLIEEKIKYEELMESKQLSSALLSEQVDNEFVKKFLNVNDEQIKRGKKELEIIRKGGKGSEFLDKVNKKQK